MEDPPSIHALTGVAHAADEIEEWSKASPVTERAEKAIDMSATTDLSKTDHIGSLGSLSSRVANQAGHQHTGEVLDISQDPAASRLSGRIPGGPVEGWADSGSKFEIDSPAMSEVPYRGSDPPPPGSFEGDFGAKTSFLDSMSPEGGSAAEGITFVEGMGGHTTIHSAMFVQATEAPTGTPRGGDRSRPPTAPNGR